MPVYYRVNGAIYLKRYAYIMSREKTVNIDKSIDFIVAEAIMKNLEKVEETNAF